MNEIESLKTFIESSAFALMPTATQAEMKQKLQQLIDDESGKNKEQLISKITDAVTPILQNAGIQIALLVTYDSNNGVNVRELTADIKEAEIETQPATEKEVTEEQVKHPSQEPTTKAVVETTRDYSKYSFNSGKPVSKRRLAWQIVKEYVKNYPDVDYAHLKEVFKPEITTKTLGVIRSIMDMPQSMPESEYPRRYMMKDEDLIALADGDIITVCSQWNVQRISKIIEIAIDEGWSVERVEEEVLDRDNSILPLFNDLPEDILVDTPAFTSEPDVPTSNNNESLFGVTLADGTYIEGTSSFDTFIQTLKKIGMSRIPEVGLTYGNMNLVSALKKDGNKQIEVDGVYVYKELTDNQMMEALQEISDYYYMDLEIGTEE